MKNWMLIVVAVVGLKSSGALAGTFCEAICLLSSDFPMLERNLTAKEAAHLQSTRVVGGENFDFGEVRAACQALAAKKGGGDGTSLLVEFSALTGSLVPASPTNVCFAWR